MMDFVGELAALATSFFFAMTALIFTSTEPIVGSQVTNRMRLTFALIYRFIINLVLFREPLPFSTRVQAGFARVSPGLWVCHLAMHSCFRRLSGYAKVGVTSTLMLWTKSHAFFSDISQ